LLPVVRLPGCQGQECDHDNREKELSEDDTLIVPASWRDLCAPDAAGCTPARPLRTVGYLPLPPRLPCLILLCAFGGSRSYAAFFCPDLR
jgi:hypothetical protein